MGQAPLKPCRHVGCKCYAVAGGYCEKHQKDKFNFIREKRISPSKLGYGRRWDAARKNFLRANPICKVCGKAATEVDHIIPHKGNAVLFWDRGNWQSLCHSCHSKKTIRENGYYKGAKNE